jgi:hypothetical protein
MKTFEEILLQEISITNSHLNRIVRVKRTPEEKGREMRVADLIPWLRKMKKTSGRDPNELIYEIYNPRTSKFESSNYEKIYNRYKTATTPLQ